MIELLSPLFFIIWIFNGVDFVQWEQVEYDTKGSFHEKCDASGDWVLACTNYQTKTIHTVKKWKNYQAMHGCYSFGGFSCTIIHHEFEHAYLYEKCMRERPMENPALERYFCTLEANWHYQ